MKWSNAAVLAFAFSAISTVAFAGDKAGMSDSKSGSMSSTGDWSSFTKVDKDSSGFIDQSEASNVQGLDFTSADADGDQRISRSEYEAAKRGKESSKSSGTSGAKGKDAAGSAIPRHSGDTQVR